MTPRGHVCCRQPLGTPGVAPFPIDPSGKGFFTSGSRPSPRPSAISPPSAAFHSRLRSWQTRVDIDFHCRSLLHFFFKKTHRSRPKNPAGGGKGNSQSEREWARVGSLLKKGVSEETLARQLEAERQDKPKPAYYAERTVTRAAASLRGEQSTTPFHQQQGDRHHD